MAKEFKRYLVTSALPYANGPVHIGHLAGVYIPSDIYTRYLRRRGRDVLSICGSDEHGVAITIKARKEGVSPKEIIDRYHNLIKRSFERLGMSFDIYSRSTPRASSSRRPPSSTTTRRRSSFWPTVTSWAPVPTARTKRPTATSARSAGRRFRPTN